MGVKTRKARRNVRILYLFSFVERPFCIIYWSHVYVCVWVGRGGGLLVFWSLPALWQLRLHDKIKCEVKKCRKLFDLLNQIHKQIKKLGQFVFPYVWFGFNLILCLKCVQKGVFRCLHTQPGTFLCSQWWTLQLHASKMKNNTVIIYLYIMLCVLSPKVKLSDQKHIKTINMLQFLNWISLFSPAVRGLSPLNFTIIKCNSKWGLNLINIHEFAC